MPPKILELIDKRDNVEIIRDQIAAILTIELEHQSVLSGLPQPRVFIERSNPWGQFLTASGGEQPIVNVWFDSSSFDEAASNVVERQKCEAVFNVDCYGFALSTNDATPGAGHAPGDLHAALEAQRAIRLARNILMAGAYTYLGLRGLVWKRWPQTISMFQPQIDNRAVQRIVAARLALQVQFNEFSPQVQGEELETLIVEVRRAETGQLYLRAEYPSP